MVALSWMTEYVRLCKALRLFFGCESQEVWGSQVTSDTCAKSSLQAVSIVTSVHALSCRQHSLLLLSHALCQKIWQKTFPENYLSNAKGIWQSL